MYRVIAYAKPVSSHPFLSAPVAVTPTTNNAPKTSVTPAGFVHQQAATTATRNDNDNDNSSLDYHLPMTILFVLTTLQLFCAFYLWRQSEKNLKRAQANLKQWRSLNKNATNQRQQQP